jgi:phage terminase small subunit
MPKGGARPGAGQKGPSLDKLYKEMAAALIGDNPAVEDLTPLEYLLAVMNNPLAHPDRRDKAAIAAAPYCHARADVVTGKKKQAAERADKVAAGSKYSAGKAPMIPAIQ